MRVVNLWNRRRAVWWNRQADQLDQTGAPKAAAAAREQARRLTPTAPRTDGQQK